MLKPKGPRARSKGQAGMLTAPGPPRIESAKLSGACMPVGRSLSFKHLASLALVTAAALWAGGCASKPPKAADYNAQFGSGRYSEAYDNSSKAAASLHNINRDQAAL